MARSAKRVGVRDAKTHLSRLLREVEAGGEVVITRDDVPVARIVGLLTAATASSSYGLFKSQFELREDSDSDSELADLFSAPRGVQVRPPPAD